MSAIGVMRRSVRSGVAAAALGTFAMDASIYRRYRRDGGAADFLAWEFSGGVTSWENAGAPALVAKRILESVLGREVPSGYARTLNNVMHWSMGLGAGSGYGLLVGGRESKVRYGIPFGAAVWAGGYVVLPQLGVYEQVWKYNLDTLAKDLDAHLVFGTATAAAFALLTARRSRTLRKQALRPRGAPSSSLISERSTV